MVVKIFRPSSAFDGIQYNTDKMDSGQGELMKISGFGTLESFGVLRPEDYCLYLEALSGFNPYVRKPQFHAMISAKGRDHDKRQLTKIAVAWLKAMGYGDQPYLIVFHRDTDNNHVHMVSTRVTRGGRKIDSAFEHVRGSRELNRILQEDEKHRAQLDAGKALGYACSTRAQLRLVLEGMGYQPWEKDGKLVLYRFGEAQFEIEKERIEKLLSGWKPNAARAKQLRAIFNKYRAVYDAAPVREIVNMPGARSGESARFRSDLGDFLHEKFGLELIFHASGDKPPYGYSVVDHAEKRVFKGSEIMRLKELTSEVSATGSRPESNRAGDKAASGSYFPVFRPYFAHDTDDQQIHGPRRRRRKKERGNTR